MERYVGAAHRHTLPHAATTRHQRLCLRALLCMPRHGIPAARMVLHHARRLLTVYLNRPQAILTLVGAFVHRYLRGDNIKHALLVAAVAHGAMSAFEPLYFDALSVCTCIFMAEAKLRMKWQHEWIPPVESPLATPAYIGNLFRWGWHNTWKYTDRVWNSFDPIYPLANILGASFIRYKMTQI